MATRKIVSAMSAYRRERSLFARFFQCRDITEYSFKWLKMVLYIAPPFRVQGDTVTIWDTSKFPPGLKFSALSHYVSQPETAMKLSATLAMTAFSMSCHAGEPVCMKQLDLTLTEGHFAQHFSPLKVKCGGDIMVSADGVTVSWNHTRDITVTEREAGKAGQVSSSDGTPDQPEAPVQHQVTIPWSGADSFTVPFGGKTLTGKVRWLTVADNSKLYAAQP